MPDLPIIWPISDEDWEKHHASINSGACYALAIDVLREQWLKSKEIGDVGVAPVANAQEAGSPGGHGGHACELNGGVS